MVEEIGLEISRPELFDVFHSTVEFEKNGAPVRQHLLGIVYVVRNVDPKSLRDELRDGDDDVASIVRVSVEEALALELTPIARKAIEKFFRNP